MNDITKKLEVYFLKKAPALPINIKKLLVQFAPWISVLAVIMTLPTIFGLLGLRGMFSSSVMGGYWMARAGFGYSLSMIFLVITLILRGLSIPGLFSRSISGWNMLYYSIFVSAVYSLLNMDIIGLIVGTVISLYFAFQVKEYYK
jgi:hypothetical protein